MYVNKWVTFSASCLLQASAGLSYCFSIFGPTFKETFAFKETQVAAIGSAINFGGYSGILAGLLYDKLAQKHRLGPRLVIWIGCIFAASGYAGLYLCASKILPTHFLLVIFFAFMAGNGGVWFDASALTTNLRNFNNQRGMVVGVLKAFLGMSASIYSSVYMAVFEPDTLSFLKFLGYAPPFFALICSLAINSLPVSYESGQRTQCMKSQTRFLMVYGLLSSIAVLQLGSSMYSQEHVLSHRNRQILSGTLLFMLATMLMIPISSGDCIILQEPSTLVQEDDEQPRALNAHQKAPGGPTDGKELMSSDLGTPLLINAERTAPALLRTDEPEPESESHVPGHALCSPVFWLLFAQFTIGISTGLVLLNNLGSMILSLGGSKGDQVVYVSLFSICNAAGRLVAGYLSEHCMHARGTPRTLFLVFVSGATLLMTAMLLHLHLHLLFAVFILGGLVFGAHWSLVPAITADIFPLATFAGNYTTLQMGPAMGGYLLATVLTGWVYEREAEAQGGSVDCHGLVCYYDTFVVLLCANALALLCSLLLFQASRPFYRPSSRLEPTHSP